MTGDRWSTAGRVVRALALLAAVGFLGVYLAAALQRIGPPFEIEWMEGGSFGHVARIHAQEPLYGPPKLASAYVLGEELFEDRSMFRTRTGDRTRPEKVFVARRVAPR